MKKDRSILRQSIANLHKKNPTIAKKTSLVANTSAIVAHSLMAGLPLFSAGALKLATAKLGRFDALNRYADSAIVKIADNWIKTNNWLMGQLPKSTWYIDMPDDLDKNKNYLLICNHQSWVDTSILQYISADKLALTRFFIKKELIYIPVVGQAFYLLDFPMMKRHSKEAIAKNPKLKSQDLDEVRRACRLLVTKPFVLLNYLEGTRFTKAKQQAQNSPYQHLLKPKAGGFALALASLGDKIDGILDMTVVYPDGIPDYSDLWAGKIERLGVELRHVAMDDVLFSALKSGAYHDETHQAHTQTKQALHDWLADIWQQKDQNITALLAKFESGTIKKDA